MHRDLEKLILLQQADREVSRLEEEIAELPKRVAVIEQKLGAARQQVESVQKAMKEDEGVRRHHESAIQDLRQKVSKYRDQSLEVKTNEQYKALMHEIEYAEKEIAALEDKILEIMVAGESREQELKAAQSELAQQSAVIEKEKTETRARTEQDQAELKRWSGVREGLRAEISADPLALYDRIRRVRGLAITVARDQKCSTCHVVLRPQKYNEIRSNEQVLTCDSCNRILYFEEQAGPQANEGASPNSQHTVPAGA